MSDLFLASPFDILVKDFFNTSAHFQPAVDAKPAHPVDIYEDGTGLHYEIACTGLNKDDVEIVIEDSILKVSYNKEDEEDLNRNYISKRVSKRAFKLGYKIASRFDLSEAEARFENGLLFIDIPFAEAAKPRTLTIK